MMTSIEQRPYVGRTVHYVAMGSKDEVYPTICRAAVITELPTSFQLTTNRCRPGEIGCTVHNPTGIHHRPLGHFPVCDYMPPRAGAEKEEQELIGGTWHYLEDCGATPSLLLKTNTQVSNEDIAEIEEKLRRVYRSTAVIADKNEPGADDLLVFGYRDLDESLTTHRVVPHRLYLGSETVGYSQPKTLWLLDATDAVDEQVRTFALDRIVHWGETPVYHIDEIAESWWGTFVGVVKKRGGLEQEWSRLAEQSRVDLKRTVAEAVSKGVFVPK